MTVSLRVACRAVSLGTSCSSSRAFDWITAASPATFSLPLTVAAMASNSVKSPAQAAHHPAVQIWRSRSVRAEPGLHISSRPSPYLGLPFQA